MAGSRRAHQLYGMTTVLVSGASGFIGSHLAQSLKADGIRVVPLSRHRIDADHVGWDPVRGRIDAAQLAKVQPDAVVHLAGEPIAQRWTAERKKRIRDSRVVGTTTLVAALANLATKPRVLVSGSAIGYYGADRGDDLLDEKAKPGDDFLARTAVEWEAAAAQADKVGIRVAMSRTGVVLGKGGGMLDRLLTPFQMGIGGKVGSGDQWLSWIAIDDMVRALRHLMDSEKARGPYNLVAPNPVTNAEFTEALGKVLGRPTIIPVPKFALELAFGTMADNTILASQRVEPRGLAGTGFEFRHPHVEEALRAVLRR